MFSAERIVVIRRPKLTGRCSGAQSKCGRRAIKGGFRRKLAETIGGVRRTLFENERTIGETDARSSASTQNA